jgi:D-alanyl-D-alanine carboxypeptidase/D-alanyl-D-alanine-endopeptidase (penicillin-binding protein 4)
MHRARNASIAALALALALPWTAGAADGKGRTSRPGSAPALSLESALAREVDGVRKAARAVGVHILDLAGERTVYEHDADQLRILASNTKLLTTAAALVELGPGHAFETRVMTRGAVEGDVLAGDLAVFGGGDPNISGRFHDGDSYAVFRDFARALRGRGIARVAGDLFLVNGIFEEPRVHPDWPRDQLTTWYEAPVDALSFSDNCVLVRVRPARKSGVPALVETVPKLDYFAIRNTARTGDGRKHKLFVTREADRDTLVVSGFIGRGTGQVDVWVAVHDPAAYFAAALRGALAEEGIAVEGATRFAHGAPEGVWELVATHQSDLGRTLEVTNKRSQNFYAESLAKFLAWKQSGHGSWPAAVETISRFLVSLGVPADAFRLADGSGLSRGNVMTARAMTTLLGRMYFHDFGREYVRSLPHSGEDGLKWERRLAQPPYRENVFAKTGTINGVSTLSGYVKATSGRVYAFSILCNQVRSNASAHTAQDRILRALIDRG